jgi:hypothetical protein
MPVLIEIWVETLPTALGPGAINQSALSTARGVCAHWRVPGDRPHPIALCIFAVNSTRVQISLVDICESSY